MRRRGRGHGPDPAGVNQPDPSAVIDPAGGYAAQLDALRSAAKWLVAAFAGVGALMLGGLSLSDIGELSVTSWRFCVAASAAVLALGTVGYMINETSGVLTHEWLTLTSLSDEPTRALLRPSRQSKWRSAQLRAIDDELAVSRHELFGYVAETRAQLHTRLRQADEQIWKSGPGSRAATEAAHESMLLRKAARDTVEYANYCFMLKLFQRMRKRLFWAVIVVAINVGAFAYAANPPRTTNPVPVKIVTTDSTQTSLGSLSISSLSPTQRDHPATLHVSSPRPGATDR